MSDDAQKSKLEVGALLLTVVGIAIGIWQFKAESEQTRQEAEARNLREFERNIWLDQYNTYRDISDALGQLISAIEVRDDAAKLRAEAEVRALYWGRSIFVEDPNVEDKLIKFRALLNLHNSGRLTDDQLKKAAANLSRALKTASRSAIDAAREGSSVLEGRPSE